jgi:uncharacterized protein YndB with AHSA1/START domain
MTSDRITVERTIKAPAASIFALLADAARHEELDGSGTVRGTKQASEPLRLGSTFGMSMKMGVPYSTSNTVVEYDQDSLIAWQTKSFGGLVGGRVWRYELTPTVDGTVVRETWDLSKDKQRFLFKHSALPATTKKNMERTLARIAETLET